MVDSIQIETLLGNTRGTDSSNIFITSELPPHTCTIKRPPEEDDNDLSSIKYLQTS